MAAPMVDRLVDLKDPRMDGPKVGSKVGPMDHCLVVQRVVTKADLMVVH